MPRNEGFLDPGAGPLASFAWDLRALREKAGKVPYRVLAKRAGFCASTLSVAASGARLPSLDVTLAYVQACGGEPEVWRERWNALATLHQPAPSTPDPDTHSGLEFAPPYDADEHGEPARLDTVPPGLQLDSGLPLDSSRPTAPQTASVSVSASTSVSQAATPMMPTPAAPTVVGQPRSGSRWRPRIPAMSVGRVATAALTVATAVLGLRVVMSEGTGNTAVASPPPASVQTANTAMEQANALYAIIYQFIPLRSDTNDAIWDVNGCRNLSNAQTRLRTLARERQVQVEQLAALDVSKVPDHSRLVVALDRAWIASSQTDTAYANIAADLQTGCTSGAVKTDPSYQQADTDAQAALLAKTEAAQLWNTYADALGQLNIDKDEL